MTKPKRSRPRRSKTVVINITPEENVKWSTAGQTVGLSRNDFVRAVCESAADAILTPNYSFDTQENRNDE